MAKTKVVTRTGTKTASDPWMLEEDYFIQRNIHKKKKGKRLNYSGKIGIHYDHSPNANAKRR
jgi:hypothetical protein